MRRDSFAMRSRYLVEYAALRVGLALFGALPPALGARLAGGVGLIWFAVDRKRRRIARENILASGITASQAEARHMAKASFVHFGAMFADALNANLKPDVQPQIESCIHPATRELLEKPGQGVIVVSGHIGNWEIAAQYLGSIKPVVGIAKAMRNPRTDRLIQNIKTNAHFQLVPMRDANAARFFSILKTGGILALLGDQHAKGDRLILDFFGRPASVHPSPALLHLVAKAPICFGVCLRQGTMRYRFEAGPPIEHRPSGRRQADVRAVLEQINSQLEQAIRRCPEQYLWAHRRWKISSPS